MSYDDDEPAPYRAPWCDTFEVHLERSGKLVRISRAELRKLNAYMGRISGRGDWEPFDHLPESVRIIIEDWLNHRNAAYRRRRDKNEV